jgi:6,7-dimethyl-8-ribityllumazine synthase
MSSIVIVVSRFNESITGSLLKKCEEALLANGFEKSKITVVWVPGAFEIPVAVSKFLKQDNCRGAIALGAIIKGDTDHDVYLAQACAQQLARLSVDLTKPVIFGVLTCNTLEQAVARSGNDINNKGWHAALALLDMLKI